MVAGLLGATGALCIAVGMSGQEQAPQPPRPAAAALEPSAVIRPAGLVLPPSEPTAIDIPAIGVQSPVQLLGLTAQHTVEVPRTPNYNKAGWYQYSSTPGAAGPAVILGHLDSARGPSVFFRLGDLRKNDEILVTRADGLVAVFEVDGVRSYPKDDFPTRLVYGDSDQAVLRLVTCGGSYDSATQLYVDNIVVLATLVGTR